MCPSTSCISRHKTLGRALREAGFDILHEKQITPALWVAQTVIARFCARQGRVTRALRDARLIVPLILLSRFILFLWLWLNNRLRRGDCLVIAARKI